MLMDRNLLLVPGFVSGLLPGLPNGLPNGSPKDLRFQISLLRLMYLETGPDSRAFAQAAEIEQMQQQPPPAGS